MAIIIKYYGGKMRNHFLILLIGSILIAGCSSPAAPAATPKTLATAAAVPTTVPLPPAPTPMPTVIPLANITLKPGDFYFSSDGQQSFMLSRNLAGNETAQYYQLLDLTSTGGSKFVRLQLDSFGMGYSKTGELDETWAKRWEAVFESAASKGIYVMPVFGVWCDWNDGTGYSTWKSNPLSAANGGPANKSLELFRSASPTQKLWLGWMKTLVERWQGRKNIIAWEIFSEVNMVPATTETQAVDFVNSASAVIREADSQHRPVTASLADFGEWSRFYNSGAIDFINIHPYPVSGKLDTAIISEVRSILAKYHKPVSIGESGLSFLTPDSEPSTLTTAEHADIGITHDIWAAVVSGAMNGRSLWWEDGVAIYFPALSLPFLQKYAKAELPAANFAAGVDFSGFQPLAAASSSGVLGAAVGNDKMVLGWFRDVKCEPPDWPLQPKISNQTVTITVPGSASNWQIDFYSTKTGIDIMSSALVSRSGGQIAITLPDFSDDIAFKLYVRE
jgi:hypothetical protein